MAHLWSSDAGGTWSPRVLESEPVALIGDPPGFAVLRGARATAAVSSRGPVVIWRGAGESAWALLVPPGVSVSVNGLPVLARIVALADRDEIRLAGERPLFFSTETLAELAPFPADLPRGFCPRCKQSIGPGMPAVRCPRCLLWYHQDETLPCWTYAPCSSCGLSSALDAGFTWTPEEL